MRFLAFLAVVVYTLFLWWFITGLIITVYGRSQRVQHSFFGSATLVMGLVLGGIIATRQYVTPTAVYFSLSCGVILWGWHVAGYYLGYITGPHNQAVLSRALQSTPAARQNLFFRFKHALQASLFHELLIVGFILLLAGLTWNAPNKWSLWIFITLWVMHSLAKINVFFGVRNFRIEFLPTHLHYLNPLLSKRATNPLLPVTIVLASVAALVYLYRGINPVATPSQTVGFLFVGTMIALGALEQLLLVLPIPAVLWGWSVKLLPQSKPSPPESPAQHRANLRTISEQVVES